MPEPTAAPARAVAKPPEWITVWSGRHAEFLVRFTDDTGRRHDWHVGRGRFGRHGERSPLGWYAWPEIPDRIQWGEPTFLHTRLPDAREELLLLVVHHWRRPFGYADGDASRPIYAKGIDRRERAFIVAELTGRAICAGCGRAHKLRTDQTVLAHKKPRSTNRCAGALQSPAVEPVHADLNRWAAGSA